MKAKSDSTSIFNAERRQVLKIGVAATGAATMLPGAVHSALGEDLTEQALTAHQTAIDSQILVASEYDLEIDIEILESTAKITLTNLTPKLKIFSHIHPGIVHMGRNAVNINDVFSRSSVAVEAGRPRSFEIPFCDCTTAESEYNRDAYQNRPLSIAKVSARAGTELIAGPSTRSSFGLRRQTQQALDSSSFA